MKAKSKTLGLLILLLFATLILGVGAVLYFRLSTPSTVTIVPNKYQVKLYSDVNCTSLVTSVDFGEIEQLLEDNMNSSWITLYLQVDEAPSDSAFIFVHWNTTDVPSNATVYGEKWRFETSEWSTMTPNDGSADMSFKTTNPNRTEQFRLKIGFTAGTKTATYSDMILVFEIRDNQN